MPLIRINYLPCEKGSPKNIALDFLAMLCQEQPSVIIEASCHTFAVEEEYRRLITDRGGRFIARGREVEGIPYYRVCTEMPLSAILLFTPQKLKLGLSIGLLEEAFAFPIPTVLFDWQGKILDGLRMSGLDISQRTNVRDFFSFSMDEAVKFLFLNVR